MGCLRVDINGVISDITPQTFRYYSFADAKIISGEKYYIDKAVRAGATRPVERVARVAAKKTS